MSTTASAWQTLQTTLQSADAARLDPVGWHYIEVLAARARMQKGTAQSLLNDRLLKALSDFKARLDAASTAQKPVCDATPSPLAVLLQDMSPATQAIQNGKSLSWRAESPRIQKFRQQLSKISVQKQITKAIAQAPQNAGPINSHMLVLRSLGLMRDTSPDYLNRFMAYVDTLMYLDEADHKKLPAKKLATTAPSKLTPKPRRQQG